MDIQSEFNRIVAEHEREEHLVYLSDAADADAYLHEFRPIELYLKQLHDEGAVISFWDSYNLFKENRRFRNDPSSVNIQIVKHFRYDCHRLHSHDYFQLNYVYSGHADIQTEDGTVSMTAGDFLLISPKTDHAIRIFDDESIMIKIYLKGSTFEKVFFKWLGENNILSDFFQRSLYGGDPVKTMMFSTGADPFMRGFVLEMFREYTNRRVYYEIIGECHLTELFCRLVRDYIGSGGARSSDRTSRVGYIIQYIIENHSTLTLDVLAQKVGYSKNYLCRLLLQSTGRTFTQLLNAAKIDAASRLLRHSQLSIAEIASHTGFNTVEHFYRVFRELRGVTPQTYRSSSDSGNKP